MAGITHQIVVVGLHHHAHHLHPVQVVLAVAVAVARSRHHLRVHRLHLVGLHVRVVSVAVAEAVHSVVAVAEVAVSANKITKTPSERKVFSLLNYS